MFRTKIVKCTACGKYFDKRNWIVVNVTSIVGPLDYDTINFCPECKKKAAHKVVDTVIDILG